ncbi:MAG: hypothetical protein HYW48_11165 [Deltaproteobacteria bacterium]|nr:hypothetical protein [Deltaproteobacteria bacterium]
MFSIVARAPTRVDLAGGTLDLWPLHYILDATATINIGIDLFASVSIRSSETKEYHLESTDQNKIACGTFQYVCANKDLALPGLVLSALWREDWPPLTIKTNALSPAGAGLGGSSTLAVTLVGALNELRVRVIGEARLPEDVLVRLAGNVEAKLLKTPTGVQDHWGAQRGGLNVIRYPLKGPEVTTLRGQILDGIAEQLLVCYSGQSRVSAVNNWEIYKRAFEGDQETIGRLSSMGEEAQAAAESVLSGDGDAFLAHSLREWELRKQLWPGIETRVTRKLQELACSAGARLSRVCGAGGGGAMLFLTSPDRRQKLAETLTNGGGRVLDANVAREGFQICKMVGV